MDLENKVSHSNKKLLSIEILNPWPFEKIAITKIDSFSRDMSYKKVKNRIFILRDSCCYTVI